MWIAYAHQKGTVEERRKEMVLIGPVEWQPRECKTLFWEKEHSRSTAMGRPWESWKLLNWWKPSSSTSRISIKISHLNHTNK